MPKRSERTASGCNESVQLQRVVSARGGGVRTRRRPRRGAANREGRNRKWQSRIPGFRNEVHAKGLKNLRKDGRRWAGFQASFGADDDSSMDLSWPGPGTGASWCPPQNPKLGPSSKAGPPPSRRAPGVVDASGVDAVQLMFGHSRLFIPGRQTKTIRSPKLGCSSILQ